MAYVTQHQVKNLAGLTGTTQDDMIARLLPWAKSVIDNFTGRDFDDISSTLKLLTGLGADAMPIPDLQAASLVRVRDDPSGDWETIASGDVLFEPADKASTEPYTWMRIYPTTGSRTVWPDTPQSVEITATWGWSTVPDTIRESAATLITRQLKAGRTGFSDTIGTPETGIVRISTGMPDLVIQMLNPYILRDIIAVGS